MTQSICLPDLFVAAFVVLHDTYFYWAHRTMHDRRLFRRVHRWMGTEYPEYASQFISVAQSRCRLNPHVMEKAK